MIKTIIYNLNTRETTRFETDDIEEATKRFEKMPLDRYYVSMLDRKVHTIYQYMYDKDGSATRLTPIEIN